MANARQRFESDAKKVEENLAKHLEKVEGATLAGLLEGGFLVMAKSQKLVPRETSNLFGSAFVRPSRGEANAVEIGYEAAYALFVHENMEQKLKGQARKSGVGVYWGPAGQPKFLEQPLMESTAEIVERVAKRAAIKKSSST